MKTDSEVFQAESQSIALSCELLCCLHSIVEPIEGVYRVCPAHFAVEGDVTPLHKLQKVPTGRDRQFQRRWWC